MAGDPGRPRVLPEGVRKGRRCGRRAGRAQGRGPRAQTRRRPLRARRHHAASVPALAVGSRRPACVAVSARALVACAHAGRLQRGPPYDTAASSRWPAVALPPPCQNDGHCVALGRKTCAARADAELPTKKTSEAHSTNQPQGGDGMPRLHCTSPMIPLITSWHLRSSASPTSVPVFLPGASEPSASPASRVE